VATFVRLTGASSLDEARTTYLALAQDFGYLGQLQEVTRKHAQSPKLTEGVREELGMTMDVIAATIAELQASLSSRLDVLPVSEIRSVPVVSSLTLA